MIDEEKGLKSERYMYKTGLMHLMIFLLACGHEEKYNEEKHTRAQNCNSRRQRSCELNDRDREFACYSLAEAFQYTYQGEYFMLIKTKSIVCNRSNGEL